MKQSEHYWARQDDYRKVTEQMKNSDMGRSDFENAIVEKIYRWWKDWKPDYEGWLTCADTLYRADCIIEAIGPKPQLYSDYRKAMKYQRDAFRMDMGKIERCVVEKDTLTIFYKMYMTPRSDMGSLKKGETYVIRVTEFNTFEPGDDGCDPMVNHLLLIATAPGSECEKNQSP